MSRPQSAAQSAPAKTPHPQSACPRTRASTCIRTLSDRPQSEHPHEQRPCHRRDPLRNSSSPGSFTPAHHSTPHRSQNLPRHWTTSTSPRLEILDNSSISDWLATLGVAVKKSENSLTTSKPALIQICQEGGTLTTNPANQTPTTSQKYSRSSTPAGHVLSRDMGCSLLEDGSADAPVTMPFILPFLTRNSTGGPTPLLKTPIIYLPLVIHDGTPTSATTPAYFYNGHKVAATSSMKNTTTRPSVVWKQQPKEGVVL
jgi:hypothetical protein